MCDSLLRLLGWMLLAGLPLGLSLTNLHAQVELPTSARVPEFPPLFEDPPEPTPAQQKQVEQLNQLGAKARYVLHTNSQTPRLILSVHVDARKDRDQVLRRVLSRTNQLWEEFTLSIEALEVTQDTLTLLGELLNENKGLVTLSLRARTYPARTESYLHRFVIRPDEQNTPRLDESPIYREFLLRPIEPGTPEIKRLQIESYNAAVRYLEALEQNYLSWKSSSNLLYRGAVDATHAAWIISETPEEQLRWLEIKVELLKDMVNISVIQVEAGVLNKSLADVFNSRRELLEAQLHLLAEKRKLTKKP